jgi:hypothetical protein
MLIFAPVEAAPGFPIRPGRAPFNKAGYFKAGTWEPGDGLMPGKYKVSVECWIVPPTLHGPPARGPVPVKYRTVTTSDLQVEVKSGAGSQEVVFDIPAGE